MSDGVSPARAHAHAGQTMREPGGIDRRVLLAQDPFDRRDQPLVPLNKRPVAIERQPFRLGAKVLLHGCVSCGWAVRAAARASAHRRVRPHRRDAGDATHQQAAECHGWVSRLNVRRSAIALLGA